MEKFAPHICTDDKRRISRFVRGLKTYIRNQIVAQGHKTLASAINAACLQEEEQRQYLAEQRVSPEPLPVLSIIQERKRKPRSPLDVRSAIAVNSATVLKVSPNSEH